MTLKELDEVTLEFYVKEKYDNIRKILKEKLLEVSKDLREHYEMAIHLSYCVENLHKNFYQKLIGLLEYYNNHQKKLPHEIYFEPSMPKVFPPPPKNLDDLPVLPKTLIHHANYYSMKSMAVTWNSLIVQYHQCMAFAINNNLLDECVIKGNDGCFDHCISEMGEWKAMLESEDEKKLIKSKV